jgi:hypothetical protein
MSPTFNHQLTSVSDLYMCTAYSSDHENECESLIAHEARIPRPILEMFPHGSNDPFPQEDQRLLFLSRPPAMGLSAEDIAGLLAFDAAPGSLRRDRQKVLHRIP